MALYAIGDLHLSTGCDKLMDVFSGWEGYVERIAANWKSTVQPEDTVVIAGDISWAMTLEQALGDFMLIDSLPGKKILLKGNHDYWWTSVKKMQEFFAEHRLNTLQLLHNNCVCAEDAAICGTRGWMLEEGTAHDQKLTAREEGRLRASLTAAKSCGLPPVVFLHYPPVYGDAVSGSMIAIMQKYGVKRCYYGHLHGRSCRFAIEGEYLGIQFSLISADHLGFALKKVLL